METDLKINDCATLKLFKMSKGYNWEIKLLSLDVNELERINNEMVEKFGN